VIREAGLVILPKATHINSADNYLSQTNRRKAKPSQVKPSKAKLNKAKQSKAKQTNQNQTETNQSKRNVN
jgi:hypothetical protein